MWYLRFAGFVGLVLLTAACLPFLHPGSVDRKIDGTFTQVFEATRQELEERGFPIRSLDREDGTIVTGKRPVWMIETHRRVEKAEARIRDEDGEGEVSLLLTFVDQASGQPPSVPDDGDEERADDVVDAAVGRSLSASAIYDDYLDAIADRVADMRTPARGEKE
jgi:hypothetical protein